MRFLADENVEGAIVSWLRSEGHDVRWAAEEAPADTDTQLLFLAQTQERILITNDRDFGELVFRRDLAVAGLLLLRFKNKAETARLQSLLALWPALAARLPAHFVVVAEGRFRVRPISSPLT